MARHLIAYVGAASKPTEGTDAAAVTCPVSIALRVARYTWLPPYRFLVPQRRSVGHISNKRGRKNQNHFIIEHRLRAWEDLLTSEERLFLASAYDVNITNHH